MQQVKEYILNESRMLINIRVEYKCICCMIYLEFSSCQSSKVHVPISESFRSSLN